MVYIVLTMTFSSLITAFMTLNKKAHQPFKAHFIYVNITGGRDLFRKLIPEMKGLVLDEIFYFELFGDDVAHTNAYVDVLDENGKVYSRVRYVCLSS